MSLSLQKIAQTHNADLDIHFVETWKKAGVGLLFAVGTIAAIGGSLAYLAHAGILSSRHLGFLGALNQKTIYALVGLGGGGILLGTVIASILRYQRHRFKVEAEDSLKIYAQLFKKIFKSLLDDATTSSAQGQFMPTGGSYYLISLEESGLYCIQKWKKDKRGFINFQKPSLVLVKTNGVFSTTSSIQASLQSFLAKNNYSSVQV